MRVVKIRIPIVVMYSVIQNQTPDVTGATRRIRLKSDIALLQ